MNKIKKSNSWSYSTEEERIEYIKKLWAEKGSNYSYSSTEIRYINKYIKDK